MKNPREVATRPLIPEQQVKGFLARFEPKHQSLTRSVRKALRKRFPSANELAYNYSQSFVIGYSANEHGIDSVIAIALGVDGLRLYFNQGAKLPDPKKMLLGSGKQTRFIRIESPRTLLLPEVKALLEAAIDRAKRPFPPGGRGTLLIKSISPKQRAKGKSKR